MAKTRVFRGKNGQYKVTIPKGIAEAMSLEGKRLEWEVDSATALRAGVVDD